MKDNPPHSRAGSNFNALTSVSSVVLCYLWHSIRVITLKWHLTSKIYFVSEINGSKVILTFIGLHVESTLDWIDPVFNENPVLRTEHLKLPEEVAQTKCLGPDNNQSFLWWKVKIVKKLLVRLQTSNFFPCIALRDGISKRSCNNRTMMLLAGETKIQIGN